MPIIVDRQLYIRLKRVKTMRLSDACSMLHDVLLALVGITGDVVKETVISDKHARFATFHVDPTIALHPAQRSVLNELVALGSHPSMKLSIRS